MNKKKFYIKLLGIQLLLVLLYTFISLGIFYNKNKEIIQLNLEHRRDFALNQIAEKIDTKFKTVFKLNNVLAVDPYVLNYTWGSGKNYYNIIKMTDLIHNNQEVFDSIGYSVAISKLNDDLVIGNKITSNINTYFSSIGLDGMTPDIIKENLLKENSIRPYYTVQSSIDDNGVKQNFLTIVKNEGLDVNNKYYLFLSFNEDNLIPKLVNSSNEAFIIMRKNKIVTMKTNMSDSTTNDLTRYVSEHINDSESEYFCIDSSQYKIYYLNSKVLDWKYVYITSKQEIYPQLKNIILKTVFVCFLLVCLGLFIAFYATRYLYRPILTIIDKFKDIKDMNTQDEFTFIKEAVLRVNTTNSDLKRIVASNKIPLKYKFLKDILFGVLSTGDVKEQVRQYHLEALENNVSVAVLEYVNYDELVDTLSKEAILKIQLSIIEFVKEKLQKNLCCEIFELDYKRLVVIVEDKEGTSLELLLKDILYEVEFNYEIDLVAVIGETVDFIYELEKIFAVILYTLDNRFSIERNKVIVLKDIKRKNEEDRYYFPIEIERDLITYVVSGKRDKALAVLQHILDINLDEKELSQESLSVFIFAIVATINRIIQMLNKKVYDFFDEGTILYIDLKMFTSVKMLKAKIMDTFDTIITKINEESAIEDNVIAEEMLAYIHKDYNMDIAQSEIARRFNLSQSYVSMLFKRYIGLNFKDYLNAHRVKVAKQILGENPQIKIKELAVMVGCNSVNSFIRMFSRYEGVSPGQYVKNRDNTE